MIQQKLTGAEKHSLEMVRYHLANVKWKDMLGGYEFWVSVQDKIGAMLRTGTNDGKPYVEPERWRVPTDEDAKQRPQCRYRDNEANEWRQGTLLYVDHLNVSERYQFTVLNNVKSIVPYRYCEILDEPKTY